MSDDQEGGTAFPIVHPDGKGVQYYGMTLRDYFAAKAMQAIITGNNADECCMGLGAAKDAYAVADAMLAAREMS